MPHPSAYIALCLIEHIHTPAGCTVGSSDQCTLHTQTQPQTSYSILWLTLMISAIIYQCIHHYHCKCIFKLSLHISNVTLSLSYVLSGFEMFERFNFNLSRGNNKTLKGKTLPDEKVYHFKFVWPWISVNFLIEMLFYLIRNPPCKYKFNVNVNWKGQSAPSNFVNRILKDYLKVPLNMPYL